MNEGDSLRLYVKSMPEPMAMRPFWTVSSKRGIDTYTSALIRTFRFVWSSGKRWIYWTDSGIHALVKAANNKAMLPLQIASQVDAVDVLVDHGGLSWR